MALLLLSPSPQTQTLTPPILLILTLPPQVPWDDLRYLMGEIMYGGHIVEDWDRRLANAYLHKYFNDSLLEGLALYPGFYPPPSAMPHPQARSGWGLGVRMVCVWYPLLADVVVCVTLMHDCSLPVVCSSARALTTLPPVINCRCWSTLRTACPQSQQ